MVLRAACYTEMYGQMYWSFHEVALQVYKILHLHENWFFAVSYKLTRISHLTASDSSCCMCSINTKSLINARMFSLIVIVGASYLRYGIPPTKGRNICRIYHFQRNPVREIFCKMWYSCSSKRRNGPGDQQCFYSE
jgi:hypothetical protein